MLYQELTVAAGQGAPEDVAANLRLYLTRFKPLPNDDDLASLAAVLCGACPEVTPVHAIRMLEASGGLLSRRLLNCHPRPRAEGPGRATERWPWILGSSPSTTMERWRNGRRASARKSTRMKSSH